MNTATRLAAASCLKADIPTTALLALCVLASAAVAAPPTDTTPVTRSPKAAQTRARWDTHAYEVSP